VLPVDQWSDTVQSLRALQLVSYGCDVAIDGVVRSKHACISVGVSERLYHLDLISNNSQGGWQSTVYQVAGYVIAMQRILAKGGQHSLRGGRKVSHQQMDPHQQQVLALLL
jgi:hypothetical protein